MKLDPAEVLSALVELPDSRAKRGVRHSFAHLLVIMVCSVVAGAKTLVEMAEWAVDTARTELQVHSIGATHATTLARVFERLDATAMELLVSDWAQKVSSPVAIGYGRQGNARSQERQRHSGASNVCFEPRESRGPGPGVSERENQ